MGKNTSQKRTLPNAARMKDIAERVGVSVTTISHVINKTRPVAAETRKQVLEAIRELNFYKNAHARRLARGKSDFFGLIVSDLGNPFFPDIIKSFEARSLERGFDLLLCNTNYDPARTTTAVRRMIENKVRGVAVMTSEFNPSLAQDLASNHVAVVFLDLGTVQPLVSNLRVDYSQGIFEAITHLHDHGHSEFAFIAGPQNLRSAVTRRTAFVEALRKWGVRSYRVIDSNHKVEGGAEAVRTLIHDHSLPTALLCSNDLTALGAINALEKAGVSVPDDVSIVGFDNIYLSQLSHPPLTTISLSRETLGELAYDALDRMLRSKRHEGAEYVIETRLLVRQSTAPVRKSRALTAAVPGTVLQRIP